MIFEKIILSIKPNDSAQYFFSVLADEAMDCSQKEQLSITDNTEILEEFVGFVHLRVGLSGKAIADAILKKISDLGLDIMNCRG